MLKLPFRFLPFLFALSAFAQSTTEAPTEKASPLTVVLFLVLFVGSCVGYFVYVWWNQKRARARGEVEEK